MASAQAALAPARRSVRVAASPANLPSRKPSSLPQRRSGRVGARPACVRAVGGLSTISVHRAGYPYGSRPPYAPSGARRAAAVVLSSAWRRTTKNLRADPRPLPLRERRTAQRGSSAHRIKADMSKFVARACSVLGAPWPPLGADGDPYARVIIYFSAVVRARMMRRFPPQATFALWDSGREGCASSSPAFGEMRGSTARPHALGRSRAGRARGLQGGGGASRCRPSVENREHVRCGRHHLDWRPVMTALDELMIH